MAGGVEKVAVTRSGWRWDAGVAEYSEVFRCSDAVLGLTIDKRVGNMEEE